MFQTFALARPRNLLLLPFLSVAGLARKEVREERTNKRDSSLESNLPFLTKLLVGEYARPQAHERARDTGFGPTVANR